MPTCAVVSFRLGGTDGVSVVAAVWAKLLSGLGCNVVLVAGEGPGVDRIVPGLELGAAAAPKRVDVKRAFEDADFVVVENLCTIPMNLSASRAVAAALRGRRAILHHHDPPWQRRRWEHVTELPPRDPAWLHVTINRLTEKQFAERGLTATTIYNGFDPVPSPGDRDTTRAALGLAPPALLVMHPVRAIERKDVPAAIRLTEQLGGTYWLLGPAEDGYGPELERVLASARCPVLHRRSPGTMDDAYAAADVVAFTSTWEGFGNPPIEASLRRRPVAVGPYPVGDELRRLGFRWFTASEPVALIDFLARPDEAMLDANRDLARERFSLDRVREDLAGLLDVAGWLR